MLLKLIAGQIACIKKRDNHLCKRKLSLENTSGGRIRTSDLRVMSPTSYQTALPRDHINHLARICYALVPQNIQFNYFITLVKIKIFDRKGKDRTEL